MDILANQHKKEKKVMHSAKLLVGAKLFFAILIAFGFLYVTAKNFDPDLGWHLRAGEQIISTGEIPRQDTFSHTMPGFEWVDHEWLVDFWLFWMHSHNLWLVVTGIFAVLALLPFLAWIIRTKHLSWLLVIFLGALTAIPFIGVRPQIISFFMFFIVFEMFRFPKSKHWGWAVLPVIFFVWANLHGGFFAGIVLFGCYLIAYRFPEKLTDWKLWKISFRLEAKNPNMPGRQYVFMLVSFAASVLATLINPFGWKLYSEIFTVLLSSDTVRYIQEWLSVASSGSMPILVFLAMFLALFIRYWREYPITILLPTAVFLMMGVKSMRNFPLLLIVATPFIFSAIELLRRDAIKSNEQAPLGARTLKILCFSAVASFIVLIGYAGYSIWRYQSGGYPEKAVDFMGQKIKSGEWRNVVLLNEYAWGGYLIWRLPETKVFIDGRMPHWIAKDGSSAMKDYVKITKPGDVTGKEKILKRRQIDTVISISNDGRKFDEDYAHNNKIANILARINTFIYGEGNVNLKDELLKNGWEIAYEDPVAVIMKKE